MIVYNYSVLMKVSLSLVLVTMHPDNLKPYSIIKQTNAKCRGGSRGGGPGGQDPPPPFGGPPNFIKREKKCENATF